MTYLTAHIHGTEQLTGVLLLDTDFAQISPVTEGELSKETKDNLSVVVFLCCWHG